MKVYNRNKKFHILYLINEDWAFWSHRLPIARAMRDAGFEITVATRIDRHRERMEAEGFNVIPIHLRRGNKNILKEILSIRDIIKVYLIKKPDIVHHVAMKYILYGSLAARIAGVPIVVNAFTGLGFVFIACDWKTSILQRLITLVLRYGFFLKNTISIFQNPDDLKFFINSDIIKEEKTVLIRGSGVNTSLFVDLPEPSGIPVITMASRMLWDKGVGDLVEATKQIKEDGINCHVVLAGSPDPENPTSVPEDVLNNWHSKGIVRWIGHREDIPNIFAKSNIVVLPSYREGLPKVLLEAASCGRPIIATDVPGCREIVRHNVNGILVPLRDPRSLANALKMLIENPVLRVKMGAQGRKIVETEFSEEIVVKKTLEVYKRLNNYADYPDEIEK